MGCPEPSLQKLELIIFNTAKYLLLRIWDPVLNMLDYLRDVCFYSMFSSSWSILTSASKFFFFVSNSLVGDSLSILRAELKSQRKHVKSLKKKSLWSKILEEVWGSKAFRCLVLQGQWTEICSYSGGSYIYEPSLIIVFSDPTTMMQWCTPNVGWTMHIPHLSSDSHTINPFFFYWNYS